MFKVAICPSIDCPGVGCGASMSMRFSTRVGGGGGGGGGGGDSNVVAEGLGLLLPEGVGNWREFPAVRDRVDALQPTPGQSMEGLMATLNIQ